MAQLIDLKVGFSCNNNCIHCVISDKTKEKDLSLEQIKELVNGYIEQYGEIQLTLTGGEVTIRKDFIQLWIMLKKRNLKERLPLLICKQMLGCYLIMIVQCCC